MILGPFDEIGNDQEIAGKAHLLDDAQFEIQTLVVFLDRNGMGDDLQPRLQPVAGLTAQFFHLVIGEARQDRLVPGHGKGAASGDFDGVFNRFGQVGEQDRHFLGRFEIVVRRQPAARLGLVDIGALGDADQRVMGLEHRRLGEIDIVGRNQRQFQQIGKADECVLGRGLGFHQLARFVLVTGQFDIKPVAKRLMQAAQTGLGSGQIAGADQLADGALGGPGQQDQTGGMLGQFGLGHMNGLAVLAQVKAARQRHQVQPAIGILRQCHDRPRLPAHVQRQLAADDRLEAFLQRLHAEFQRREHGIRIGQRHRRHSGILGQSDQLLDGNRPFQQRMLGMGAEMDESWLIFRHAVKAMRG